MQRPSLPDLSRPNTTSGTGMKHSSSAPPPPPPGRRANAPPTPLPVHSSKAQVYNREKPLPPTPGQRLHPSREGHPAPPPLKPPPSPVNIRTGPSGQSLAPPPPPYRQPPGVPNGPSSPTNESAPELPQRHNSLHRKTPGPVRGLAPPPPTSASPFLLSNRPPPPARDPPSRGAGKCLEAFLFAVSKSISSVIRTGIHVFTRFIGTFLCAGNCEGREKNCAQPSN